MLTWSSIWTNANEFTLVFHERRTCMANVIVWSFSSGLNYSPNTQCECLEAQFHLFVAQKPSRFRLSEGILENDSKRLKYT